MVCFQPPNNLTTQQPNYLLGLETVIVTGVTEALLPLFPPAQFPLAQLPLAQLPLPQFPLAHPLQQLAPPHGTFSEVGSLFHDGT